jgi:hypothetical protein
VTTLAGVTYERTEIEATLSGNGYIDPTCNIRVMSKLIPNKEVKRQGEQWLADRDDLAYVSCGFGSVPRDRKFTMQKAWPRPVAFLC